LRLRFIGGVMPTRGYPVFLMDSFGLPETPDFILLVMVLMEAVLRGRGYQDSSLSSIG